MRRWIKDTLNKHPRHDDRRQRTTNQEDRPPDRDRTPIGQQKRADDQHDKGRTQQAVGQTDCCIGNKPIGDAYHQKANDECGFRPVQVDHANCLRSLQIEVKKAARNFGLTPELYSAILPPNFRSDIITSLDHSTEADTASSSGPAVRPREAALAVFAIPQFRWLFTSNLFFFFAMQGQMLTRSLLAWELTEQATALAMVNLVVAVPMIFASVLGGAVTDRVERRQLVVIGQTLVTANEIFILSLLLTGHLQFWHMLCTAFVAGCALPFIMPARMAMTMKVVGPPRLQSSMGYQSATMNLNRVVGPAVMGLIIARFGYHSAYELSIGLYVVAIACMFGIDRNYSDQSGASRKPLLTDIGQGFAYIRDHRPVLVCLIFGLLPMFVAMPVQNFLVVLAEEVWGVNEGGVGILMAAGGAGGVLGALWIVRRGDNSKRLRLMLGSTIAFAVFLALFTQTANFYLALLPLLIANLFANAAQTVNNSSIQLLVEDHMRGRMSSFMMLSFGLTPIGVFPMALAADRIGAASAVFGAAVLLTVLVVAFYTLSKTLRSLDNAVAAATTGSQLASPQPGKAP